MSTARPSSARQAAKAPKQATAARKSSPAVNGHALDLASLFPLRQPPGYYNEPAKVALLRRQKRGPHDELLVDFRGPDVVLELRGGDCKLVQGAWSWQATAGGESLAAAGPWTESCWHTDAACDYLELELPLTDGWRLERQMLLARKDRFLLLADSLLGPGSDSVGIALRGDPSPASSGTPQRASLPGGPVEIHYSTSLPLAAGVDFALAGESREGSLAAGLKRQATLLPLALPEWRAEFCHADFSAAEGRLTLQQSALGNNLYAPLWIDLDSRRSRRQLTWRRLTVAEDLHVVPRDVAAGYRVQIGVEQWLVYRSLAGWGNRTVLGQNYATEFVCSRFLRSGETSEILAIEPA